MNISESLQNINDNIELNFFNFVYNENIIFFKDKTIIKYDFNNNKLYELYKLSNKKFYLGCCSIQKNLLCFINEINSVKILEIYDIESNKLEYSELINFQLFNFSYYKDLNKIIGFYSNKLIFYDLDTNNITKLDNYEFNNITINSNKIINNYFVFISNNNLYYYDLIINKLQKKNTKILILNTIYNLDYESDIYFVIPQIHKCVCLIYHDILKKKFIIGHFCENYNNISDYLNLCNLNTTFKLYLIGGYKNNNSFNYIKNSKYNKYINFNPANNALKPYMVICNKSSITIY